MSEYILETRNLEKTFRKQKAVTDLNLKVRKLSIIGLYWLHLVLELYHGKGVSLMIGGMESLIAILFLISLGD